MVDFTILMHAVAIAHGIGASALCAAIFYLAGMFISPRARSPLADTVAPAVIGAALYVMVCWFGVAGGIPVSRVALIFFGASVFVGVAGYRKVRARAVDPAFRTATRQSFAVFALVYSIAYLFTMPSATPDELPVAWTGNIDLMTYVRYTRYFLTLGPSNLTDFTYFNFVYHQTPGLFFLLGGFSLFFEQDPLAAAMPVQFALVALTGTIAAAMSRTIFGVSLRVAIAIACIFVIGPFFRYVAANYFLSTLMAMPVVLYLLWRTVQERANRILDLSLAVRFGAGYVLLLFVYPFLLFVGLGLQVGVIVLRVIGELQRRQANPGPRAVVISAIGTVAAALAVFAVLGAVFWARFVWSVDMIVSLSEKGIAGWPLGFISPQAMFAWPGISAEAMQVAASSERWAMMTFAAIALVLAAAYFWWFRSRTTPEQSALAGLLAVMVLLYCAYFSIEGPSYQQWKFASYSVLPLSFVFMAAVAQALGSSALLSRVPETAGDHRLLRSFPFVIAAAFIGGNAAAHAAYDPALRRLPGELKRLADIDKLSSFREITVRMHDIPDGLPTWVALYYLPNKKVHVVSTKFSPSGPLALEQVSRQRPLLMHNFGCEGVGHDGTMMVEGVGCLLYAPPSLQFGVTYPFNRTFLFMPYEGMTARSSDGRWNSRTTVPLKVLIDPERTQVRGPVYLNLSMRPKDGEGPVQVAFRWSADRQAEASIAGEERLSIPLGVSDWTGNRLWALTVLIDVPDRGLLLFRDLSVTEAPLGRVLGKPVTQ